MEEGKAPGCTNHLVKIDDHRQQWNSDPHSKDPPKEVDCRLTSSPVKSCGSELQPAATNTEQQNQSGSSHKAEQAPERDLGEHHPSQQQLRTSVGSCLYLPIILFCHIMNSHSSYGFSLDGSSLQIISFLLTLSATAYSIPSSSFPFSLHRHHHHCYVRL